MDAIGIADTFADAGFVVVSIDLPLHGIGGADAVAANPFYDAAHELTFNLDLVNNSSLAAGPDGKIDPSGTHFVNVPNPLVTRDNLRQGAVDLLTLTRSLGSLDLDGVAGGDIDTSRIHFIGHSLGGIVGGVYLGTAAHSLKWRRASSRTRAAASRRPSSTRRRSVRASRRGLSAQGITEGSTLYAQFIRDAQTAVDAGDPINYIASATLLVRCFSFRWSVAARCRMALPPPSDQVVVNSATGRLITAGGLDPASRRPA